MRALNNTFRGRRSQEYQRENLMKKLLEIQNTNKEKESIIQKYEQQVLQLEKLKKKLDEELQHHEKQWKQLQIKLQKEKNEVQDQQEMNNWIQNVQKYNGLPEHVIDSLCSMEFEGGQQQICLSCYQELSSRSMCTYLPCCHLFHKECIGNHLKVNIRCPACQQEVKM